MDLGEEVIEVPNSKLRKDGRSANQIRQFAAEQGLLNRADGSARFTQGNSSVLVSVYGPMEVKQRKELIDKASIDVCYRPRSGLAGSEETEKELYIRSALEESILSTLHPRTAVNIVVQVLSEDGSMLSTAINAVCLALLDAGVAMKSQVASVSSCLVNGTLVIDPSELEEKDATSTFVFAFNHPHDGLVTSKAIGRFSEEQYFNALEASKQGCDKLFSFIRGSFLKKYNVET